ncbi:MAG: hypothetical protein WD875_16900 [Pirellulales bacterium]
MFTYRAMVRPAMRLVRRAFFVVAAVGAMSTASVRAQSSEFDDWRRFEDGSWCEIRTISETLDEQGEVVSTTTSTALFTLAHATDDEVTLDLAAGTVEYGGKSFAVPAAKLVLHPFGRSEGEKITIVDLPVQSTAGAENVAGRSLKAVIAGDEGTREITTVFRNASARLPERRIVKTFDAKGDSVSTSTTDEYLANFPYPARNGLRSTTYYGTLYRNHKVSSTAIVAKSADVPGQLVSATTIERDASGRIFRRTSQELVDYYAVPKPRGATIGERIKDRRDDRRERRDESRGFRYGR